MLLAQRSSISPMSSHSNIFEHIYPRTSSFVSSEITVHVQWYSRSIIFVAVSELSRLAAICIGMICAGFLLASELVISTLPGQEVPSNVVPKTDLL
jgi:hypothetical protein